MCIFSDNPPLDHKVPTNAHDNTKHKIVSEETIEDSNVTERLKKERLEKTKK